MIHSGSQFLMAKQAKHVMALVRHPTVGRTSSKENSSGKCCWDLEWMEAEQDLKTAPGAFESSTGVGKIYNLHAMARPSFLAWECQAV